MCCQCNDLLAQILRTRQSFERSSFLVARLETEIVYFVNVIDAKLQKAATILLAGPPSLGSAKSAQNIQSRANK